MDSVWVYSMSETQITLRKWILLGSIACLWPRLPPEVDPIGVYNMSETQVSPEVESVGQKHAWDPELPPPPEMDPVGVYSMSETQFTPEVDPVRVFSRSVIRIIGCILTAPENYNHL